MEGGWDVVRNEAQLLNKEQKWLNFLNHEKRVELKDKSIGKLQVKANVYCFKREGSRHCIPSIPSFSYHFVCCPSN